MLGFLFSQKDLIEKPPHMHIDQNIRLDLCHMTVAPPFVQTVVAIEEECRFICNLLNEQGAVVVRNKSDLARDGLKVVLGLQHPPIDATVKDLRHLRSLGVLFCTLAYEQENDFGGGFAYPKTSLTLRGREFLTNLAEAQMVLDLSHAGHTTARDALRALHLGCIPLLVVATHTGLYSVYEHPRNLPEDIFKGIKYFGGFVGISTCTFMNDNADNSLLPFFRHLHGAVTLLGGKHVCIGSDGIYQRLDVAADQRRFALMKEKIDPRGNFRARYPDQPLCLNDPQRMQRLKIELLDRFSEKVAARILGKNFFDFLVKHLA